MCILTIVRRVVFDEQSSRIFSGLVGMTSRGGGIIKIERFPLHPYHQDE